MTKRVKRSLTKLNGNNIGLYNIKINCIQKRKGVIVMMRYEICAADAGGFANNGSVFTVGSSTPTAGAYDVIITAPTAGAQTGANVIDPSTTGK